MWTIHNLIRRIHIMILNPLQVILNLRLWPTKHIAVSSSHLIPQILWVLNMFYLTIMGATPLPISHPKNREMGMGIDGHWIFWGFWVKLRWSIIKLMYCIRPCTVLSTIPISSFFEGLNKKSASYLICEIHIYIDSESFR